MGVAAAAGGGGWGGAPAGFGHVDEGVSPVPVQMWRRLSPVPVQMWAAGSAAYGPRDKAGRVERLCDLEHLPRLERGPNRSAC